MGTLGRWRGEVRNGGGLSVWRPDSTVSGQALFRTVLCLSQGFIGRQGVSQPLEGLGEARSGDLEVPVLPFQASAHLPELAGQSSPPAAAPAGRFRGRWEQPPWHSPGASHLPRAAPSQGMAASHLQSFTFPLRDSYPRDLTQAAVGGNVSTAMQRASRERGSRRIFITGQHRASQHLKWVASLPVRTLHFPSPVFHREI